jgi:hypothetical protein
MRLTSSSAGCVPTHENHAGDVSRRRALRARRSGGPKYDACGSWPAHQPAAAGTIASSRSGRTAMNAVPRGAISHL